MKMEFRVTSTEDGYRVDARNPEAASGLSSGWSLFTTATSATEAGEAIGEEIAYQTGHQRAEGASR